MQCKRKIYKILIDKAICTKGNDSDAYVPVSPSNVIITKLALNEDRKAFLSKKMIFY